MAGQFHLVTASNAVHTCNDIASTLSNIYDVLADDGFLLFYEYTGVVTSALWGVCEDVWKYNDKREFGLWISLDHWKDLLSAAGFTCAMIARAAGNAGALLLYRKVPKEKPSRKFLLQGPEVNASNGEMQEWLRQFNALKDGEANENGPQPQATRIWLWGDSKTSPGLPGMSPSIRLEPGGSPVRTAFNLTSSIYMPPEEMVARCEGLDLVANVFKNGVNGSYRSYPVKEEDIGSKSSKDGGQNGTHVEFKEYGNISSKFWVENAPVSSGWTRASVAFCALNFKDVMLAYGRLPREEVIDDILGGEFSGQLEEPLRIGNEVYPAGQRIFGAARFALATKVAVLPYKVHPIPSSWSYAEAATVRIAYTTAYYAMIMRGGLQPGQSVLIHSGAGAVGLAAIRICLHRGCEVFTTCSSEEKRNFLLGTFPDLKCENIGDSRSCAFEPVVMEGTKGRGVDFCLNSLDQDKLQASVRCIARNGTLLEIGKF
eukprot:jgi/Botrbrau1/16696/Bobra.0213s0001.1